LSLDVGLLLEWSRGWIGGVDYVRNLVLAVASLPEEERRGVRLTLVYDPPLDPDLAAELSPHLHAVVSRKEAQRRMLLRRLRWRLERRLGVQADPRLASLARERGLQFVYPFPGRRGGRAAGFRSAAWIPDFQERHMPQFFTPEDLQWRREHFAAVVEGASRVVLSSESAAEDFRRFYPAHAAKAVVMKFAVFPHPQWTERDPLPVQAEFSLPDRFFLVCNQLWQHKNHLRVFEALRRLREAGDSPHVVCTGHLHDYRQLAFLDEVLQTIHRYGIASHVHLLGLVPRAVQVQLMRRCLAVLQPSLFEGWSTVVELAKSLGRPMLLSDLAVHREQHPEGPFFERESAASLAALLAEGWRRLEPGPDLPREAAARTAALERCRTFARQFLELARSGA
jgi:glycosyltransferase involved in cell wall biosynthesis